MTIHLANGTQGRTCMPGKAFAFGFRRTRRTSFLELTTTRLAEGLGPDTSLALEGLVGIVRKIWVEWIRRVPLIDVSFGLEYVRLLYTCVEYRKNMIIAI